MLRSFVTTIVFALVSSTAFAGFHIEPYLGYESGNMNVTDTTDQDTGGKTTMMDFGVRLGYLTAVNLWFGVDAMMGTSGTFKESNASSGVPDATSTRTDIGATIGYEFPIKLRAYATYNFSSSLVVKDDDAAANENTYTGGTSYKVGFGYRFLPFMAFNAEYYSNAPTKYSNSSGSFDVSSFAKSFGETGYRLVLSFPLH